MPAANVQRRPAMGDRIMRARDKGRLHEPILGNPLALAQPLSSAAREPRHTVLTAANGQDGLHVAHEHNGTPIRLVLTDVIMPLISGKVMADWLIKTDPALKILFTSDYTNDALTHHGVLEPGRIILRKSYPTRGFDRFQTFDPVGGRAGQNYSDSQLALALRQRLEEGINRASWRIRRCRLRLWVCLAIRGYGLRNR
jgi:CheY-like chemotaxis protein